MKKKYELGMILVLGPLEGQLGAFFESSRWILRERLDTPVEGCTLICENLKTGVKIIFGEDDFSHYVDLDALLFLDCEAKDSPQI